MALTKYDVASAALVLIGAAPVSSFASSGSAEQIACHHLYQTCVDHWLSLYPWRFATRITQLSRSVTPPDTQWQAAYLEPPGMKALQAIRIDRHGSDLPFDRAENTILIDATATQTVWAVHTYDAPITRWPGYFMALIEVALAAKLAFALSAKLDLKAGLEKEVETYFRLAKNADSRQQTTRKFRLTARRSIMEARRA